jgi:hypothetical protein
VGLPASLGGISHDRPDSPLTPPEPTAAPRRFWPRRYKIATALLAAVALIVVIIGIAIAAAPKSPTGSSHAAAPTVTTYATAGDLVGALNSHSDTCANASYSNGTASCTGGTTVLVFPHAKTTADVVKVGHDMITLASSLDKPEGVAVGPDWIVSGSLAFASKVQHNLGGQYFSTAAAVAVPTPTPTPTTGPEPINGGTFTYTDNTTVSISNVTTGALSAEAAGGNPGDLAVFISVKVTAGSTALDASQIQVDASGGPNGMALSQVFDGNDVSPDGTIDPGQTQTNTFEFDTQGDGGSQLQVTVTPGFNYDGAVFTGSQ